MVLIVFVTVMLSILGLFIQVFSLQTAKLYQSQNVLGQMMVTWHSAAVSFVRNNPPAWATYGLNGCSVTATITSLFTAYPGGTAPILCSSGTLAADGTYLLKSYAIGTYNFYSVAYANTADNHNYVVTFVYSTIGKYITLPDAGSTTSIGFTLQDLNAQLNRIAGNNLLYGLTTTRGGAQYIAIPNTNGGGGYMIPNWIPSNAVAMITQIS